MERRNCGPFRLTDLIAHSRDGIEERDGPCCGRPRAERTQTREKRTPLIHLDVRYHELRPRSASHAKDDATMCRVPLPGRPAHWRSPLTPIV